MKPRKITENDKKSFGGICVTFKCPPGMENCNDVEVLKTVEKIRIPWEFDRAELEVLQEGLATGKTTIWLTIWGEVMPPVDIQVV